MPGCPGEQIGTCEGCSDKECLDRLITKGICLVHGEPGCDCTLARDRNGYFTTRIIPREKTMPDDIEICRDCEKAANGICVQDAKQVAECVDCRDSCEKETPEGARVRKLKMMIEVVVEAHRELGNWACNLDNRTEGIGVEQALMEDSAHKLRIVIKNLERLLGRAVAGTWGDQGTEE